jgi:glycerophosphoryl diester phosphodiesterase
MLVIGHRGSPLEALENSWAAFERAIEVGCERIELDVQRTKDGHLAVVHDESLLRTAGVDLEIADLDRSEIAKIKLNNGEPIPFIDEVVERLLPRVELNIEIKGDSAEDAELVAQLVKASGRTEKVIVSSFRRTPLEYLASEHPDLTLACLWGPEATWPYFAHYNPLVFMNLCRAKILHPWVGYVNEEVMDQAKNRGWKVYPYAGYLGPDERVGREELWAHLQACGVDGLCTNYPLEMRAWLKEQGPSA